MKTLGEYRVGIDFNPSSNERVAEIKTLAANLIDLCDTLMAGTLDEETRRLYALAMTQFEDGAMWAVKGATKKPK